MSSYTLVVKGGLVVSGQGISLADIAIIDEKVALIAPGIAAQGAMVIDAAGKYVLPGAIDVHTHPVYTDDLGGMSVTAAFGGVTTMIHYACLLYTSPSPRDRTRSRMPSSA